MNAGVAAGHHRLAGIADVGPYDAIYVAAEEGDAVLSCAARLVWTGARGLRALVVTFFDGDLAPPFGADHLSLGLPSAARRESPREPWRSASLRPGDEEWVLKVTALLEEILRKARPRHLYLPLGIGGFVDSRIVHEGALRTFHEGAGRDLFLYEERPEAFVCGSVRIRLGEMGARLPPAAPRVAGEGGLVRFLLRLHTVPALRGREKGPVKRLRSTGHAARRWFGAWAWRPLKALGPRLHPLVHVADPSQVEPARALVRAAAVRLDSRSANRILKYSANHARRLGVQGHAERYWLLLPPRDDGTRPVGFPEHFSTIS
jgi:hypothetical protein